MTKKLLLLLFTLIFIPITLVTAASGSLHWSTNSLVLKPGETKSLTLAINTNGDNTLGADILLNYNFNIVSIDYAIFSNPAIYSHNFFTNDFLTSTQNALLRLSSTMSQLNTYFNGDKTYVTLYITGKQIGSTSLKLQCSQGATNDSNITSANAVDILNCSGIPEVSVNVQASSATGVTSPTATPTPSPSCVKPQPPSQLTAFNVDSDTILLRWTKGADSTNHHLVFGINPDSYQFGAANFGDTNQILVNFLKPNTLYHFGIISVNGCGVSSTATISKNTMLPGYSTGSTGSTTGFSSTAPKPTTTPRPTSIPTGIRVTPSPSTTPPSSLKPLPTTTPTISPSPQPDIELSDQDLQQIPSIDSPLETETNSATALDETPVPTPIPAQTTASTNKLLLLLGPMAIVLIIALGAFAYLRLRGGQTPPLPPQNFMPPEPPTQ